MREKLEYFIILLDFGRATTAISKNTRTQASKPYNDQIPFSVSSESTFPIIRRGVGRHMSCDGSQPNWIFHKTPRHITDRRCRRLINWFAKFHIFRRASGLAAQWVAHLLNFIIISYPCCLTLLSLLIYMDPLIYIIFLFWHSDIISCICSNIAAFIKLLLCNNSNSNFIYNSGNLNNNSNNKLSRQYLKT